ncbi:unnamed protein product [Acanthosepion pharaonis]|uniref:Globin domain-containing protein n=1 Tax=Acanthosepion pharaonis TaxID=158019 RepID=A0A812DI95_ACAPH|nr:unnamed protein product [Sepia pharaonis]
MSPRDDEEVDSKTGLKVKEKRAMTQSWKCISPNLKAEGMHFFNMLFTDHPDYIDYFPSFRGKKLEEFNTKATFKVHARNVFYAINMIVETLDDADELVELLLKTGRDHYRRGIPISAFHNLAIVFDKYMAERAGKAYTPLAKASWMKALTVVNALTLLHFIFFLTPTSSSSFTPSLSYVILSINPPCFFVSLSLSFSLSLSYSYDCLLFKYIPPPPLSISFSFIKFNASNLIQIQTNKLNYILTPITLPFFPTFSFFSTPSFLLSLSFPHPASFILFSPSLTRYYIINLITCYNISLYN